MYVRHRRFENATILDLAKEIKKQCERNEIIRELVSEHYIPPSLHNDACFHHHCGMSDSDD